MLETLFIDQRFYKNGEDNKIPIFVAKAVNNFSIFESSTSTNHFISSLNFLSKLGEISNSSKIKFLVCVISFPPATKNSLSRHDYMSKVARLDLQSTRTLQKAQFANDDKNRQNCRLSGTLLYPKKAVLPHASFFTSKKQQKFELIKVWDLVNTNEMVAEL